MLEEQEHTEDFLREDKSKFSDRQIVDSLKKVKDFDELHNRKKHECADFNRARIG